MFLAVAGVYKLTTPVGGVSTAKCVVEHQPVPA